MIKENEESISFVRHTNLPYEISGEEKKKEVVWFIVCSILFYILTILVLCF